MIYKIINLPGITDKHSGNLAFIEGTHHVPFEIKRVYYIYDIKEGEKRGRHAYKNTQSFMIVPSGHFDLTLDDGYHRETLHLSNPHCGIYIPGMIWKELDNFSEGAVCLVLVSDFYVEEEYIRDYDDFVREARHMHHGNV